MLRPPQAWQVPGGPAFLVQVAPGHTWGTDVWGNEQRLWWIGGDSGREGVARFWTDGVGLAGGLL